MAGTQTVNENNYLPQTMNIKAAN